MTIWQHKYPQALSWAFGDTPSMANALAALVVAGKKRATCCSLSSFLQQQPAITPGCWHIVLDGARQPCCVIRTLSLQRVRFEEVTAAQAALEGEGDLSLAFWRREHRAFFIREGTWTPDMELIYETFVVIETAPSWGVGLAKRTAKR